ncbi:MAG: hypothetical protein LBL08_02405 [Candidatus Nomurabacteria bacterium]|nr:hypothetical protein [Candidatus Nomurabacteria bacterium]
MEQESKLVAPTEKNKFKTLSIIFIILTALLAAATAYFVIQFCNQKSENANLQTDVEKAKTELNTYQTKQSTKTTKDTTAKSDPNKVTAEELLAIFKRDGFEIDTITDIQSIKNSSVAPYQTIKVSAKFSDSVGGGGFHFYREGVSGEWQYGYGGQQSPSCGSELFGERPVLQKAFADETCSYIKGDGQTYFTTFKEFDTSMVID